MIRTQVQFTEEQIRALKELSAETGRSVADLTRDAVNHFLLYHPRKDDALVKGALSIVGAFASGSDDGSSAHDEHLSNAFR
jgi:hypothetical protein